jgi:hypothetical protein
MVSTHCILCTHRWGHKMLMEPNTLSPLHVTISYLQMTFHLQAFGLLASTYSRDIQYWKPADGNGSKGNSRCFQIVHVVPALYQHTSSGSLAECLCRDHIQRLWFGSTTEFLIERENLWYETVLKASHASTKGVPPAVYDTTILMCIDKTDTSKDNNQLWMRQQNVLLWENIPCICSRFDEATLLAGGRARGE